MVFRPVDLPVSGREERVELDITRLTPLDDIAQLLADLAGVVHRENVSFASLTGGFDYLRLHHPSRQRSERGGCTMKV